MLSINSDSHAYNTKTLCERIPLPRRVGIPVDGPVPAPLQSKNPSQSKKPTPVLHFLPMPLLYSTHTAICGTEVKIAEIADSRERTTCRNCLARLDELPLGLLLDGKKRNQAIAAHRDTLARMIGSWELLEGCSPPDYVRRDGLGKRVAWVTQHQGGFYTTKVKFLAGEWRIGNAVGHFVEPVDGEDVAVVMRRLMEKVDKGLEEYLNPESFKLRCVDPIDSPVARKKASHESLAVSHDKLTELVQQARKVFAFEDQKFESQNAIDYLEQLILAADKEAKR